LLVSESRKFDDATAKTEDSKVDVVSESRKFDDATAKTEDSKVDVAKTEASSQKRPFERHGARPNHNHNHNHNQRRC
jgi:hypothetical protein